jgi:hypothetical protein
MSFYWYGPWKPLGRYEAGSVVEYEGSLFKARVATTCLTPGVLTSGQCKTWEYVCRYDEVDWNAPGGPLRAAYIATFGIPPIQMGKEEVPVNKGPQVTANSEVLPWKAPEAYTYDKDGYPLPHFTEPRHQQRYPISSRPKIDIITYGQPEGAMRWTDMNGNFIPHRDGGEYAAEPNIVAYDPAAAQDLTLRSMRSELTVEEVRQLRLQLQEALHAKAAMYSVATRAVDGESRAQNKILEMRKKEREALDIGPLPPSRDPRVEIRIGDTVRNRYIDHLSNMLSDGVLTQEEFEQRMDMAATAKHESELKTLVQDLPDMPLKVSVANAPRTPVLLNERGNWLVRHKAGVMVGTATFLSLMFVFLCLTMGIF